MNLIIKNGELINPKGVSGKFDILVQDGKITQISENIENTFGEATTIIDAKNQWVMPGFVDMHCHLREPGQEYKEDIASGTKSAAHGGYTSVACMPNTAPVNDDLTVLSYVLQKAKQANAAKVLPICSVTKGLAGKELSEIGLLTKGGAVAFSDDGKPIENPDIMRLALQYAKDFDALIISHCEDKSLAGKGVMNEGYWSAVLGLEGISRASEEAMIARDIIIAQTYDAKVHIAHISTKGSVELIANAKAKGVKITCETAPHYFSATDEWVNTTQYDTNTKMNPPLRTEKDVEAIIEGLGNGTIDAIATDHAPHHDDEKNVEFNSAYNGIVGFETAFSLAITNLIRTNKIAPAKLVELFSTNPCNVLKIEGGVLETGKTADITIADPNCEIVYTKDMLHSKSKNTPFVGLPLFGRVKFTIVDGKIVAQN